MQAQDETTFLDAVPGALREPVQHWFEQLPQDRPGLAPGRIAQLGRLVACSEFAASVVRRDWDWFVRSIDVLDKVPDTGLLDKLVADVHAMEDIDDARQAIRRFRHRWLLQVLWRELAGVATLAETLTALSDLADQLLDAAAGLASKVVRRRFGEITDAQGNACGIVILGMGKLGGRELNFSSDIDLVFLYPGGKESNGRKIVSAQEYFTRVSQHIVALLDEVTADGFAFRIDTRLRPFGDSGPPVTSFAALESYLLQHGRYWERYAYVKARIVGPRVPEAVAKELNDELITPFVYRRYLDYGVFESLRDMHGMISAEVLRREMADNVKLGPGGIREIEFIVQSLQLVRGGSRPELQDRQLLRVLPGLVGPQGLAQSSATALRNAYMFLRRLENFMQAIRDRQTHELPADDADRARLCLAMGFASWDELLDALNAHRDVVTREFEAVAFRDREHPDKPGQELASLWDAAAPAAEWEEALRTSGVSHADTVAKAVATFVAAPATRQADKESRRRLRAFIPELLLRIGTAKDPVTAVTRVLAVLEKILRRSAYIALLNENPAVMSRLIGLCERSAYIAGQIALYPVLLDELLDPSVQSSPLTLEEQDRDLSARLAECPPHDSEAQISVLGQFQRANQFRVAVADFAGTLPIMKVSDSLTWLAEAVLKHALDIAWRDLVARHGEPGFDVGRERHKAGFGIIAYGKLGGLEMSYGSDLDLVFLHDSSGTNRNTDGPKPLDNTVFFTRLVRRLSHFLTAQTGSGMLYEVDTRLRPDGQSGVMVSSVDAFERYQVENAWTWEHQALLRARPVAGSQSVAEQFTRIRAETLSSRVHQDKLKADVIDMRQRMRVQLDKSDDKVFDMKQGKGGIADIEFIVQYLVLCNAGNEPSVYYYSDNIRQLDALAACGCIEQQVAARLQDIYRCYRLRQHHLTLDNKSPLVGQDEFGDERAYVEDLWNKVL